MRRQYKTAATQNVSLRQGEHALSDNQDTPVIQKKSDLHKSYQHTDWRASLRQNQTNALNFVNVKYMDGYTEVSFVFPDNGPSQDLRQTLFEQMQQLPGVIYTDNNVEGPIGHGGIRFFVYDLLNDIGFNAYQYALGILNGSHTPIEKKSHQTEEQLFKLKKHFPGLSPFEIQFSAMMYGAVQIGIIHEDAAIQVLTNGQNIASNDLTRVKTVLTQNRICQCPPELP